MNRIYQGRLDAIDQRCKALGITRSQYFVKLAEADLHAGGPFTIQEKPGKRPPPPKSRRSP